MATEDIAQKQEAFDVTPARPDFPAFYREAYPPVARALAVTLADPALGEEAADEAMARAYARWSSVERQANPTGWAYRAGLDWARSKRRRTLRTPRFRASGAAAQPPVSDPALHGALGRLDVDLRAVVVCRYQCDWSIAETAEVLGVREDVVRSRLQKALTALEHELGGDGDDVGRNR